MSSTGIIAELIKQAIPVSQRVAVLLDACEELFDPQGRGRSRKRTVTEVVLLKTARSRLQRLKQQVTEDEDADLRLARLALRAWDEKVRPGEGIRPDVLGVTCQALANPNMPQTFEVARFAIVLALRNLYKLEYTNECLVEVRKTYDDLRQRFVVLQRRRQRSKHATRFESLLVDVLCLEGSVHRSLTPLENLHAYYEGFSYPFGVTDQRRTFAEGVRWPELGGSIPDFGSVVNLLFSQPTAVRGFDEVTGGLVAGIPGPKDRALGSERLSNATDRLPSGEVGTADTGETWAGGLISLVSGPPGSGKTSLCLSIASRMAQMGASVWYVATEELTHSLKAKRTVFAESATTVFWPELTPELAIEEDERFHIVQADDLESFDALAKEVLDAFGTTPEVVQGQLDPESVALYLTFPRVIVVDSLTALLQRDLAAEATYEPGRRRQELGNTLNNLRKKGVCLFLIGGKEAEDDEALAYLVDNVFTMDVAHDLKQPHSGRSLTIKKTRLQTSHSGRHVFHLSPREGCEVSPSLQAVLRSLRGRSVVTTDENNRAIVWAPVSPKTAKERRYGPVTIREHSQILLYGRGSAGKSRLALALAYEPAHRFDPGAKSTRGMTAHLQRVGKNEAHAERFRRTRTLVLSFLYGRPHYEQIAVELLQKRFGFSKLDASELAEEQMTVIDFYPGMIYAETIVDLVRNRIRAGKLDARPYTSVVVDGVHNMLLQFPLLQHEPLIWPTLFRLFRTEGMRAITTFTFFRMAHLAESPAKDTGLSGEAFELPESVGSLGQMFFHLLVGNCDYTFLVERPEMYPDAIESRNWVAVKLASSLDGYRSEPDEFWWDLERLRHQRERRYKDLVGKNWVTRMVASGL